MRFNIQILVKNYLTGPKAWRAKTGGFGWGSNLIKKLIVAGEEMAQT